MLLNKINNINSYLKYESTTPYHDNTNIKNFNINGIVQLRIKIILNDEESFNEETPLINEKILQHYEANMRKRGIKKLSTCNKIILFIILTIFIFIIKKYNLFYIRLNNKYI